MYVVRAHRPRTKHAFRGKKSHYAHYVRYAHYAHYTGICGDAHYSVTSRYSVTDGAADTHDAARDGRSDLTPESRPHTPC